MKIQQGLVADAYSFHIWDSCLYFVKNACSHCSDGVIYSGYEERVYRSSSPLQRNHFDNLISHAYCCSLRYILIQLSGFLSPGSFGFGLG